MAAETSLRHATVDDAVAVHTIYAPVVVETPISFEYEPPDAAELARRIEATVTRPLPWLVAEIDNQVVGFAYALPHRERAAYAWSVDTSVYVSPRWHRQQVGRRLYESLLDALRHLGYINAYAGITLRNDASTSLHLACGYTQIGVFPDVGHKFGHWHDASWWHHRLTEPPAEPLSRDARTAARPMKAQSS